MVKESILSVVFCLFCISAFAQEGHFNCGHSHAEQKHFEDHPEWKASAKKAAEQLEDETKQLLSQAEVLYIPVVFHIIHQFGEEYISDDQVHSAMSLLNRDLRKLNPDTANIVIDFRPIAADSEVEFRLAQLDPNGNCTNGITRTESSLTDDGSSQMKTLINWPRNKYLNVWVCRDIESGAAGYSLYPSSVADASSAFLDGIVLRHDYIGTIGTSTAYRGRSLIHEVGHWLNLAHPWGSTNEPGVSSNCNFDDNVNDTPLTIGWTDCNISGESCSSLDNVQNYMEYSYCSKMFTEGQKSRLRSALSSSVAQRNQLWSAANLAATGILGNPILCEARFEVSPTIVCIGEELTVEDESYNSVDYWQWDMGDGTIYEGDDPETLEEVDHAYNTSGNFEITLTVSQGEVEEQLTKSVSVFPQTTFVNPLEEGFEGSWEDQLESLEWFVSNENDDFTWELTDAASFSGENSIWIKNRNVDVYDSKDELISQTYDLSDFNTINLTYDWAYANKPAEANDKLLIYGSGDCGNSLTLLSSKFGASSMPTANNTSSNFIPDEDEWMSEQKVITDSLLFTEDFRLVVRFVGRGGNNIYLDNINLNATFVGIDELNAAPTFSLYPNPTSGELNIVPSHSSNKSVITIYDMAGRKVEQWSSIVLQKGQASNLRLPSDFSKGMYMLIVADQKGSFSLPLMVE